MMIYLAMIDTPEERDFFEAVYTKYRYLMLHVANKILQNHHDAEDAVHEAFLSVIKNLDKFSDVESPKTRSLIVLIVERKAIDILRKKHKKNLAEINEDILGIEMPAPGDLGVADAIVRLSCQSSGSPTYAFRHWPYKPRNCKTPRYHGIRCSEVAWKSKT